MKNIIALGFVMGSITNPTIATEDVLYNAKWRLPNVYEINEMITEQYGNSSYSIGMITIDIFKGKIYVIDTQDFNDLSDEGVNPRNAIPIKDFEGYSNYDYELEFWSPYNIRGDYYE